jgi:hypothetical protein
MNIKLNNEDTIFIVNIRIRMIRDILRLDADADLFLHQTIADMEFINSLLDILTTSLLNNSPMESDENTLKTTLGITGFVNQETYAENLSDTEWQFSQLLNEFLKKSSPFSPEKFPELLDWINRHKEECNRRRRLVDEALVPIEKAGMEPVVSQTELNLLLDTSNTSIQTRI